MTDSVVELLLEARRAHRTLDALPPASRPANADAAYVLQAELSARLGEPAGWKIACTTEAAQQKMQSHEPFAGPLFADMLHESPTRLRAADFHIRVAEAEFAFRLGKSLPAREHAYRREEVVEAIDSVHPAIEIADCRFSDWLSVGVPSLIADGAVSGALICGTGIAEWRHLDLVNHAVRLSADGETVGDGTGAAALGDPVLSMLWMVNRWSGLGFGLQAGQIVTTGSCTGNYMAVSGQHLVADFGTLGQVEVTFG